MLATTCYFAWGCFRYFSWEREPRRPLRLRGRANRRSHREHEASYDGCRLRRLFDGLQVLRSADGRGEREACRAFMVPHPDRRHGTSYDVPALMVQHGRVQRDDGRSVVECCECGLNLWPLGFGDALTSIVLR